jgi:hypothetical protein
MFINFSAVKYFLNDLVYYWEGENDMPALEAHEYAQGNEYYQNVKAVILYNNLYEDIQIGFSYILNNSTIDTSKYMDVFDWEDSQIRELLTVAYSSIFKTKEPLKTSDTLELKEIDFKDWWVRGTGKAE